METTEKIYCYDRGDNDNALLVAILAGNNYRDDWGPYGRHDGWRYEQLDEQSFCISYVPGALP